MTTKLYVAGPMSGYEGLNFPAFERAAAALRAAGYDVVSPHEVALACGCSGVLAACEAGEHGWADFLRADLIALLGHADGLAVLPGWEASKGANLEVDVADRLDIEVHSVEHWLSAALVRSA